MRKGYSNPFEIDLGLIIYPYFSFGWSFFKGEREIGWRFRECSEREDDDSMWFIVQMIVDLEMKVNECDLLRFDESAELNSANLS